MSDADLHARVDFIENDFIPRATVIMESMQSAVDAVSTAITKIEVLIERDRQTKETVEKAEARIDKIDDRVKTIEMVLPGLKELRKWVIGGIASGIAMLMTAISIIVWHFLQTIPTVPLPH